MSTPAPVAAAQRSVARPAVVPAALAALTVLAQIAYPLTSGDVRNRLTVATVVLFFTASALHALLARGVRWAATLVGVSAGVGLVAESFGTRTGLLFGQYSYADTLGAKLLDVPLVIPLAWTMMAYPSLLLGRRLSRTPAVSALLGGATLATWDLFLDPQMVAAGHWRWLDVQYSLPGVPGIPVSNFLGWLVVAVVMVGLLEVLLPRTDADDRVPTALLLWTYYGSVLANAVFFHRPGVALAGGIGMGLLVVPWTRALLRR